MKSSQQSKRAGKRDRALPSQNARPKWPRNCPLLVWRNSGRRFSYRRPSKIATSAISGSENRHIGYAPLHFINGGGGGPLRSRHRADLCWRLIEAKADVNARTARGKTAWDLALHQGNHLCSIALWEQYHGPNMSHLDREHPWHPRCRLSFGSVLHCLDIWGPPCGRYDWHLASKHKDLSAYHVEEGFAADTQPRGPQPKDRRGAQPKDRIQLKECSAYHVATDSNSDSNVRERPNSYKRRRVCA